MKFRVTLKTPDALIDAISAAINDAVENVEDVEERAELKCQQEEQISRLCSKWFSYGEYLTVEINTETKTCVVVEA
jgi:hypothetical protein